MKKQLSIIMSAILFILTLSACSKTQNEFYSELKKSNSWDASQVSLKGNLSILASAEESMELAINVNGYSNTANKQSFFEYSFADSSNDINMNNIKMFIDDTDYYINKDYFANLYINSPKAYEKINTLDSDYICVIQNNPFLKEFVNKSYDVEFIYSFYEQIATKLGIDIPIIKNGNAYSISTNGEQLVDEFLRVYENFINNLDTFNNDLELNFTQDEINSIKSGYNKDNLEIYAATLKAMIKNSKIDITYDFKDDSTVGMNMNLNMPILIPLNEVENMSIIIKMNLYGQINKAEVKTIEMPSSSIKLTQQQLINLLTDYQPN